MACWPWNPVWQIVDALLSLRIIEPVQFPKTYHLIYATLKCHCRYCVESPQALCLQGCCFMLLPLHCTFTQPWGHSCPPCVAWNWDETIRDGRIRCTGWDGKYHNFQHELSFFYKYLQSMGMETAPQPCFSIASFRDQKAGRLVEGIWCLQFAS